MESNYFAYGSNLLASQMRKRTDAARWPRLAFLPDYRLAFEMEGGDGCVYANVRTPGDGVYGVVYRCTAEELAALDRYETGYDRRSITVRDADGKELPAEIYLAKPDRVTAERAPSAEYWRRILTGAREQGLPEDYILQLQSLAGV